MTLAIALVLVLLVVAIILFATELLPMDVTALLILSALLFLGLLEPKEAFAAFGNETILTIGGLFVLTRALLRTGVIERLGGLLQRRAGKNPNLLVRLLLSVIAGVSAFMSNTATAAVFLPLVLGLSRRSGIAPSKILMPLSYASILGGTITVIGTSTNLVVSGVLPRYNQPSLGFFELAWVGVPLVIIGLLYLLFVAPRLLPDRSEPGSMEATLRDYLADLTLDPGSVLEGKTLREAGLGRDYGLWVASVRRDGRLRRGPGPDFVLQAGDTLLAEGNPASLVRAKNELGVHSKTERQLIEELNPAEENDMKLVEVVVMPNSPLLGRTLRDSRFRERYGLSVLGLHRRQRLLAEPLSRTRIQVGDVLLILGPQAQIDALESHLAVMGDVSEQQRDTRRAPIALSVFGVAILLGALGVVPLAVAVVGAVAILFATRVISSEEGYRNIEWSVLMLIASMVAFGTAFESTGAAKLVAGWISEVAAPLGPYGLLAAFSVLTIVLTQPMSNQAAALVVLPIALGVAQQLDLNPRTFAIAITVAASNSFISPLEPASMLVFGPGRYRFTDFIRVGSILTALTLTVSLILIPIIWPFEG
ncbi:di/tricarboxylate transporter [Deinobacterium chartae]|uniref:Di/tricarboxylate transporter n=1 Tax=Deinobacterium chartae TaxID=521158 RepID=A0A841HVS4_9DEIO|nr:SLC13 family permease [Deinobacterium chartae]MBB6097016.1 di/tricarboxylate transporter [Deinobacterium chartae]